MRRLTYKTLAAAPFLSVIVPLTTAAEPASPASLASEASGADFHVAPDGDDRNPGTLEKPFATPGRARDAVRALKTAGPGRDFAVQIRGGTYRLRETVDEAAGVAPMVPAPGVLSARCANSAGPRCSS